MRTLLTLFFSIGVLFPLMAQIGLSPEEQAAALQYKRYRSIFLGVGPRILNTDGGKIELSYTDDSPSMDQLNSTTELKDTYVVPAVQFGYKFGRYNGLSHDILFDAGFGDNITVLFAYSIGWNFRMELKDKPFLIRPAIQGQISNTQFKVGELRNNDTFIQIGERQYFEDRLDANLRAQNVVYALKLDFTYRFANRVDAFLKVAYDVPSSNRNTELELSVPENLQTENSPGPSTLSLTDENPMITYNGERLETLPYDLGGLRFTVGVSYLWNRRK